VAPSEVLSIIQDQILKIAHEKNGGLLTLGLLGTIWSTSSGLNAIIDTLNQAYDIQEARPWWKVKLIALGLTVALAVFIVISFTLVGPALAEKVAVWAHMGPAFAWSWKILQWSIVFLLVTLAVGLIYYFAPDAVKSESGSRRAPSSRRRCGSRSRSGSSSTSRTSRRTTRPMAPSAGSSC
jgi:membrane protein